MSEDQASPPNSSQPPGGSNPPPPNSSQPPSTPEPLRVQLMNEKTRLDWRQVIIIPLVLAILASGVAYLFGLLQSNYSFQLSDHQHNNDLALASAQQRETAIDNYLNNMSMLLTNQDLRSTTAKDGPDLRSLARAQTLTVLSELGNDGVRKARVVNFLHDANLINRGTATIKFPIVSLASADLRWAALSGVDLGGADLAASDLTEADLTKADLMGADLDQSILKGAVLKDAMLDYAQLVGADLQCADPANCTHLDGADLSGADFIGAVLTGAVYNNTDVSGTTPPSSFTQAINSQTVYKTTWNVTLEHSILRISYRQGDSISVYGILDMNSSKLQVVYGPLGNGGTSVVLFPAVWSITSCPGDYCQTASVTGGTYSSLLHSDLLQTRRELSQNSLTFTVSGTIADLSVEDTLTFPQPKNNNSISVRVSARSEGTITLDQFIPGTKVKLQAEAFKPVLLTAMYDSSSTWTAQKAAFGNQTPFSYSDNYTRIPKNNISTFELVGGTPSSVNVRNAPTISVTLNSLTEAGNDLTTSASVTLQVQPSSDQSDNVNMWLGVDSPHLPDAWSYTVTASMPPI